MALLPGLHTSIPAARYHADDLCAVPTLSSGIAKVLLAKTPRHAWIEHPRLNPAFEAPEDSRFDLGSVAHEIILCRGGGFEVLDFPNWATKASKEAREAAREAGRTPVLKDQHSRARHMAEAVWGVLGQTPGCSMFDPDEGQAETVGLWQDIAGPVCRMMVDWIGPAPTDIWDLKTSAAGLSDEAIARTIENLGYDVSAAFYLRGLHHLRPDLAGRFRFNWVFVEDQEPFEVRVIEADPETLAYGHRKAALAIAKWQACLTSGEWPGYPREITRSTPPAWAGTRWLAREVSDPDFDRAVLLDHHPIPQQPADMLVFGERLIPLPTEAA